MTPELALRQTRIVWFAMLGGPVAFLFVVAILLTQQTVAPDPPAAQWLFRANLVLIAVLVPLAMWTRLQSYKRHWQNQGVTPKGYFQANFMFFVVLEGMALWGLVTTLLNGAMWPTVLPSGIALALLAVNFPSGAPMHAHRG